MCHYRVRSQLAVGVVWLGCAVAVFDAVLAGDAGELVTVTPKKTEDILANPGMGWETFHRTVRAGADGTYALPHVDLSPNLVYVARAEGHMPQRRQSDGSGVLDFELPRSLALEGVVVDPRDAPLPGAHVYLHRIALAPGVEQEPGREARNFTTSGEGGAFRFDGVLPGQFAVRPLPRQLLGRLAPVVDMQVRPGEALFLVVPLGVGRRLNGGTAARRSRCTFAAGSQAGAADRECRMQNAECRKEADCEF